MDRTTRGALAFAALWLVFPGSFARGDDASTAAERARSVLKTYCYRCHGQDGRNEGGLNVVTDLTRLIETKRVIPGDPEGSKLIRRVSTGDMPPEVDSEDSAERPAPLPRPKPEEVAALRAWVKAGAFDPTRRNGPRKFVSDLDVLKLILDDLRKSPSRDRKYARYFTLTHLANAGCSADQLQTYRHGLSKLLNSLSWSRSVKPPTPVDPAGTVLRIDLRDYLWDETTWSALLDQYPYGLLHEGTTAASVEESTACPLPYIRADWFVHAASRPPLYHRVLRLPENLKDLERKLDVDAEADIRQDRVARAAFNASGVSRNNRLIERHESSNGGYWKSYDFAGNADRKNLFSHPLGPGDGDHEFQHDGGEIIFALPNGLQGYMLVDARGDRIEKGPTEIVRDNKQADGAVVNGISCMSCHARGLIEKADQLREVVARSKAFEKEVVETVKVLYPPREQLDRMFHADMERFARAVKQTGASLSRTEPVFALANQFEEELNLELAAAESGLRVEEFRDVLLRVPRLGQSLGPLASGGTVKRDAFVDAFPLLAEARRVALLEPSQEEETSPARTAARAPAIPEPSRPSMPRPASPRGRSARPADRLAALPPSFFGGEQDRFTDLGPSGGVLVGVRVSYKLFFGGPKISSVAPIYRTGSKLVDGKRYGTLNGPEVRAVAKAGYAVGAFRTRAGLGVDGFEMVFMKVKGSRLDPNDSYVSPWLGDTNGGSPQAVLNPGGLLPVGLQGRASGSVRALGLIVVP